MTGPSFLVGGSLLRYHVMRLRRRPRGGRMLTPSSGSFQLVRHYLLDGLRRQEALSAERGLGGVRAHEHHRRQPLDLQRQ